MGMTRADFDRQKREMGGRLIRLFVPRYGEHREFAETLIDSITPQQNRAGDVVSALKHHVHLYAIRDDDTFADAANRKIVELDMCRPGGDLKFLQATTARMFETAHGGWPLWKRLRFAWRGWK